MNKTELTKLTKEDLVLLVASLQNKIELLKIQKEELEMELYEVNLNSL